jgi:hypothetical protein
MNGMRLALTGDFASAIEAFQRSRLSNGDAIEPALNLFQAYLDTERMNDAEVLASELARRWPDHEAVFVALAKWREKQGRPAEALQLIRDPRVNLAAESHAYPVYLRLLLANSRFEEAIIEAERGLSAPLWKSQALLTKGAALLSFSDVEGAIRSFEQLDSEGFGEGEPLRSGLLPLWTRALARAGDIGRAKALIDDALSRYPDHEGLTALRSELGSSE